MSTLAGKKYFNGSSDYYNNFWNTMRGNSFSAAKLGDGMVNQTGGYVFPAGSETRLKTAVKNESLFRNLATVVKAYNGPVRIIAKDCEDLAQWVPENGSIPVYDGMDDFTGHTVGNHKLAVFVKLDNNFIHDSSFSIEEYLTKRISKNIAKAEDLGFVTGNGNGMPVGILDEEAGAEVGVTGDSLTFDKMIELYFSLDPDYRKKAVWMMNDHTALALRLLKDENGNYLWNHNNDTILGRPVVISNDMPSAEDGARPVVFGDFSYYWIIDRCPVSIKPLTEKFVLLGQVGYLAMEFLDAKLIRRDALKAFELRDSEQSG